MQAASSKAQADAALTRQDTGLLGDSGIPSRGGNSFYALIKQLLNSKDIVPEVKELLKSVFGDVADLFPTPRFDSSGNPYSGPKVDVQEWLNGKSRNWSSPGAF